MAIPKGIRISPKYISIDDTTLEIRDWFRDAFKIQAKINSLNKEIKAHKELLDRYTNPLHRFLIRTGFKGIEAKDKLLYLQAKTSAPSFKEVIKLAGKRISKEVRELLVKVYESGYKKGEEKVILKDGGLKDGKVE